MSLVIERCSERRDLSGLAALCGAHAEYEGIPFDPAAFEERLWPWIEGADPSVFIWTAREEGGLRGYAAASVEFSTLAAAPHLHLDCLFVSEGSRSRGVGARLMGEVARLAREKDLWSIEWQTPAWNTRAARFYERLGANPLSKLRFSLESRGLRA